MTAPGELALFSLDTDPDYARRVASYLGIELARHELRRFEDGEHKCRALDSVQQSDVFVIHSLYGEPQRSVSDKLCELLFFCRLTERCGCGPRYRDNAISLLRAQGPAHAGQ